MGMSLRRPPKPANVEETMSVFAALDVSQELTAVCVVNQDGSIIAEAKVATCPNAITAYLECWSDELERVGMRLAHWPSGCGTLWWREACRSSAWTPAMPMAC